MMGQFSAENAAVQEMEKEELMKKEISRENISNRYIQDLYRFFKLYIRRTEFTDPFAGHINLLHVSVLNPLLSDSDSLLASSGNIISGGMLCRGSRIVRKAFGGISFG